MLKIILSIVLVLLTFGVKSLEVDPCILKGDCSDNLQPLRKIGERLGWQEVLSPDAYELMDISSFKIKSTQIDGAYFSVVGSGRFNVVLLLEERRESVWVHSLFETGTVNIQEITDIDRDGNDELIMKITPGGTQVPAYDLTLQQLRKQLVIKE